MNHGIHKNLSVFRGFLIHLKIPTLFLPNIYGYCINCNYSILEFSLE